VRVAVGMSETKRLEVDVWLDVACPWCALGERRLDRVIDKLPFGDAVDVRFHSYQLDPNAPDRATITQAEYLAGRGLDPAKLEASHEHLSTAGREIGFEFDHDAVVPSNTWAAHRMIQAAAAHDVQREVVEALLSEYFQKGLDVGDSEALKAVAVAAGLDEDVAQQVVSDPYAFEREVKDDVARAGQLGIQGVPFYVLDGRYGVSGAQSAEVFEQALTQVYGEINPTPAPLKTVAGTEGETCGPDGCPV